MKLKCKAWLIFLHERFSPVVYIPFTILLVLSHFIIFKKNVNSYISLLHFSEKFFLLFTLSVIFFFILRLYDEIKDFETDKINYPQRPLVRKLLIHRELYNAIAICIFIEVFFSSLTGVKTFIGCIIPLLYSLLMYKEFFIKTWIRNHLTLYAITHTFVAYLFSLTLFSLLFKNFPWELPSKVYLLSFVHWFLFNIFEFSRKTFVTAEERKKVESYSNIFGMLGAVMLVVCMAILICIFFFFLISPVSFSISLVLLFLLVVIGLKFSISDKQFWGKCYRTASFAYIGLIYITIIIFG
jgi:hypothetical protein